MSCTRVWGIVKRVVSLNDTTYSKSCVKQPLSKGPQIGFEDQLSLNAGQKCRMLWYILQFFRPSLRHHLSLRSLFCLFLSGRFIQISLYAVVEQNKY